MLKRILFDPAFLFLVAINLYCIWYYQNNPDEFNTIVFLYWGQSVLIGLFNFVDMLTVKNVIPGSIEINDTPVNDSSRSKGCTATFFLVHYGFFHLAYGIFILVYTKFKIDFHFVLIGLVAFSLNLIIQFARHKQWQATHPVNLGSMFFFALPANYSYAPDDTRSYIFALAGINHFSCFKNCSGCNNVHCNIPNT